MSDIRCAVCKVLLGRKLPDGAVEIREKGRLVARIKWGQLGCTRCGNGVALDVVPPRAVQGADQWTVVGLSSSTGHRVVISPPE